VLRIDHVVYAVSDLDEAGERLLEEHGLASVPGGQHPRWGTGNRIVPLGEAYVELLAVVDPRVARASTLGRAIGALAEEGGGWFALCLSDDALDQTAARLGLEVETGGRQRPDGEVVRWRSAGIEDPRRTPDLPFFIAWEGPRDLHPGRGTAAHPAAVSGIASVDVAGDEQAFVAWTDGASLPVRFATGRPGVVAVRLLGSGGDVVLP
jgi:Glyoxalase-like domain